MRDKSTSEGCVGVILAGGIGRRFGGAEPKQYMLLRGMPVVLHSVATFDALGAFDMLVLAARRSELKRLEAMVAEVSVRAQVKLVEGGATRAESSWRAVQALDGYSDDTRVLIHDAARPLVSATLVERMLAALDRAEAAVPGVRPTDAIVEVREGTACLPRRSRESYRLVQTPQSFRLGVLRAAYTAAFSKCEGSWDDDASVVSQFAPGVEVVCVDGELDNFKITHGEDLSLAERILARRRSGDAK